MILRIRGMPRYRRVQRVAVEFGRAVTPDGSTSPGGDTRRCVDEKRQERSISPVTRSPGMDIGTTHRARMLSTWQSSEEEVNHVS
jgi:hypothetical protein